MVEPIPPKTPTAIPDDTYSNTWRALGITFGNILTQDPAMLRALERAQQAAQTDIAILILGETGTGKTLVAQAVHNASTRREGPFVAANCAGLPDTLVETELFGHEAGAFTDARKARIGHFERANGGTLFLDEIGDMALIAQQKLLHAFEHKQFYRVGGERMIAVDLRFILATHQSLDDLVRERRFRQDLYYRIKQCPIELPPLRARKGDIELYVDAFVEEANERYKTTVKKVSRAAMALLREHDWPGNVRELRAVVQNAVQMCRKHTLEPADFDIVVQRLGPAIPGSGAMSAPGGAGDSPARPTDQDALAASLLPPLSGDLTLALVEKAHIQRVLDLTGGNKKEAARMLDISRPTLDRKIKLYQLRVRAD